MPTIRFNQVFVALLACSFLSAFVIPERGNSLRGHLQGFFSWVSRPAYRVAGGVYERWEKEPVTDKRGAEVVKQENDQLKVELAGALMQLETMKQLNAGRDMVGAARAFCVAVPVAGVGADAGKRESLSLQVKDSDGVKAGMVVLYPYGVAGKVDRAGMSGAQVRLITDPGFRVEGVFLRPIVGGDGKPTFGKLSLGAQIVAGVGKGQMQVRNMAMKTVKEAGLAVGDWCVVADGDWPVAVQGYRLGVVESIEVLGSAPLYADVRIRPGGNLMGLREVMVMVK